MQNPRYLTKRGRSYYFRFPIPTHLRSRLGCAEFKCSLRTSDLGEARIRCRELTNKFDQMLQGAAMTEFSQAEMTDMARSYFRELLIQGNDQVFRIREMPDSSLSLDEALASADTYLAKLAQIQNSHGAESVFSTHLTKWLSNRGLNIPAKHGDTMGIMASYVLRAELESQRILKAKISNDYANTAPVDPLFIGIYDDTLPPLEPQSPGASDGLPLNIAIQKFRAAKAKTWAYKTDLDFNRVLNLLETFIGSNRQLASITTPDIGKFRDLLLKLPKNFSKLKKNAGSSIFQATAETDEAGCISPKTADKYLNMARSFFYWCEAEGFIDKIPGKKLTVEYVADDKARLPFTAAELETLFASPIWRGSISRNRRSKAGDTVFKNAYYWIPLIACYTGMRCGEIVQLRHTDMRVLDGVTYIDVNDDAGKKLKTKYSRRRIPLHPRLLEWGFMDFVQKRDKGDSQARIFSEISISAKGDPSNAYSKTFARYLDDIGLTKKELTFHSFRHTLPDALDNASVPEAHKHAMMGHSDKSASVQYGIGASIAVLFASISKISYSFEADFMPSPPGRKVIIE